jgi:hypothetical protein
LSGRRFAALIAAKEDWPCFIRLTSRKSGRSWLPPPAWLFLGANIVIIAGAGDIWGWGRVAALLAAVFWLYFFIQRRALRKQELQEKEIAQVKMLREISGRIFSNILEADITENRIIGKNARKLAAMLGLEGNDRYDVIIDAIAAQLVREEFREEYRRKFSRETITNLCMDNQPGFEYEFVERPTRQLRVGQDVCVHLSRVRYRRGKNYFLRKKHPAEKERELAIISKASAIL